jgi:beta-lactamase regulating signal transducer with metallopeptidase domain
MMWPQLQTVAGIAIGRILNSLPEGLLIAVFAWVMLRVLPRQNSGTRFAVWFMALLAVAGLPVAGLTLTGVTGGRPLPAMGVVRPLIALPGPCGLLLFLAWVLASFVAMLRLAVGLWRLHELRRSCIAIESANLDPAIRKTIADFNSSRSVTLATSERVGVPAAIGFFKPMIVIPGWVLRELPPDELNIVLLHELAHLRRWDDWTNLLQKIVRAVFLFHPAVWWIESRLSLEREMACDDQVLAETSNPNGYAKCLIALLEKSFARRGWAMAQAVVRRAREASLRLARILDASRPNTRYVWRPALGLVGAFSLVCLMVVARAPQLVAIERNTRAIQTDDTHSELISQSPISAAAVSPATMHSGSSSPPQEMPQQPVAQVIGRLLEHRRAAPRVIAARRSPDSVRNPVDTATEGTNESVLPVSETLLIIRTTERVGPNSWVWSVGVWRVTLVNSARDEAKKEPVANRT